MCQHAFRFYSPSPSQTAVMMIRANSFHVFVTCRARGMTAERHKQPGVVDTRGALFSLLNHASPGTLLPLHLQSAQRRSGCQPKSASRARCTTWIACRAAGAQSTAKVGL